MVCHAPLCFHTERKQQSTLFTLPLTLFVRMRKRVAKLFHVFSNSLRLVMRQNLPALLTLGRKMDVTIGPPASWHLKVQEKYN